MLHIDIHGAAGSGNGMMVIKLSLRTLCIAAETFWRQRRSRGNRNGLLPSWLSVITDGLFFPLPTQANGA